jgi:hypothetical protein
MNTFDRLGIWNQVLSTGVLVVCKKGGAAPHRRFSTLRLQKGISRHKRGTFPSRKYRKICLLKRRSFRLRRKRGGVRRVS